MATNRQKALVVDGDGNICATGCSHCEPHLTSQQSANTRAQECHCGTNLFNGAANLQDQANLWRWMAAETYVTDIRLAATAADYATVKYSSAGVASCGTNLFNGQANLQDEANAILVDDIGGFTVTGLSHDAAGNWDFATIS